MSSWNKAEDQTMLSIAKTQQLVGVWVILEVTVWEDPSVFLSPESRSGT